MAFDFATDKLKVNSLVGGLNVNATMPAMDLVLLALQKAGLLEVLASIAAPTTNQATTAWLNPAVPSHNGDGTLFLWNGAAYAPATQALFADMLTASSATANALAGAGVPAAGIGADSDLYFRTDAPGGTYLKTAGVWALIAANTQPTVQLGLTDEI